MEERPETGLRTNLLTGREEELPGQTDHLHNHPINFRLAYQGQTVRLLHHPIDPTMATRGRDHQALLLGAAADQEVVEAEDTEAEVAVAGEDNY